MATKRYFIVHYFWGPAPRIDAIGTAGYVKAKSVREATTIAEDLPWKSGFRLSQVSRISKSRAARLKCLSDN